MRPAACLLAAAHSAPGPTTTTFALLFCVSPLVVLGYRRRGGPSWRLREVSHHTTPRAVRATTRHPPHSRLQSQEPRARASESHYSGRKSQGTASVRAATAREGTEREEESGGSNADGFCFAFASPPRVPASSRGRWATTADPDPRPIARRGGRSIPGPAATMMEPYAVTASPKDAGGGEGGRADPDTGLEGAMWRLGLGTGGEGAAAAGARLPERPGEANCVYYLRTGACGYGESCRYNHPRDRAAAFDGGAAKTTRTVEYPERPGQPSCEYYMKNGSCKFGSNCKYNHPREGGSVQPVVLNSSGYPLRLGEKECSYYIKTGHCKFGSTCKFHHPQGPEPGVVSETTNMYPPVQQPLPISSSLPYPPLANWQLGRPSVLPGSYFPGSYPPMMHPSAVMPMQGWNPYMSPMNQVASAGGQQTVQAGPLYGLSHQGPPSAVAYGSNYAPLSSSTWPSSNKQEVAFPERPGQPECHHYMKTGTCKFGATCKYNHPQYHSTPTSNCMLSPLGLPMRPGAQPCVYYSQHGFCKYGPGCKFDHPLGGLSYSPSASSLGDMPIAPYTVSILTAPMAPSPSSSVPRPEYILGTDSSAYQPASPGTTFGPAGPVSKVYAPHMLLRPPTSTTGATVTSHGGEL